MANTTNLNLSKLAGTEKLKSFPSPYNDNMDAIDGAFGSGFGLSGNATVNDEINSLGNGLAIIANGNTHAAITSGQYVYVRGHGTLSDGLYHATANIAQDGTLSGSNLTADSSGGLNALNSKLSSLIKIKEDYSLDNQTIATGNYYEWRPLINAPTGYSFLSVTALTTGDRRFHLVNCKPDGTVFSISVANYSGSNGIGAPQIRAVFIRTDAISS